MSQVLTRLYDTYEEASAVVRDLEAARIAHDDISLIANNADNRYAVRKDDDDDAAEGATAGAGVGGLVGGGAGLLAGLGIMAIPGVGPVVAAGWLVATLVGAAAGATVGAAAGGLIGALTDTGVSEEHAHVYAEGVRRGGALVTVRVEDSQAAVAASILDRHDPVDPSVRGTHYRATGWTEFDPELPAYRADQIQRERDLYRNQRPV